MYMFSGVIMSKELEKLKSSNNELREIVNNSWDGIAIIDKNSKFLYVNNAFSPILGFTKDEFLKKNFISFITDEHKEDFENLMQENILNKYQSEVQVICERKDKQKVYLQITISLMLNQEFFVINARDITKQISDDEILNNYVISTHTDLNGAITKASKAFCLLSGYSKKELIGNSYSFMKHPDMEESVYTDLWETIKNGQAWSGKLKYLKKDLSYFWVNVKIKQIYNKYGDTTGFTSLMFDITNELLLKDDKKTLEAKMDEATVTIEQKDKILVHQSKLAIMAETLQMVSHEWRQPLNVISIQAQKIELDYTINDNIDEEELLQTLRNINDKANELSNTIEDFQGYVNLKSEKRTANSLDIIQRAISTFNNDPHSKDIKFIKETVETPEFETYANELSTVLVNIFINAKESIIKNNIQEGAIKLKEYYKGNTIYFEISDNAGGINEDIIDKIFDPYFSTKEECHGVGLGLYMCKTIIEMHFNGVIGAKNSEDGANITIALPMK